MITLSSPLQGYTPPKAPISIRERACNLSKDLRSTSLTLRFASLQDGQTDIAGVKQHVKSLIQKSTLGQSSAEYILKVWQSYGIQVNRHSEKKDLSTLWASFGPSNQTPILISTHYDAGVNPGRLPQADYNGSGLAALLELSRIIAERQKESSLKAHIIVAAFPNEQLPYERTDYKTSEAFSRYLKTKGMEPKQAVSLDMIGHYSNVPNSQPYPRLLQVAKMIFPYLEKTFPSTGNFIALVGNLKSKKLLEQLKEAFLTGSKIEPVIISAPGLIPGILRSDHRNFENGVMLTDTGYLRGTNHYGWNAKNDTIDVINFEMLVKVIDGVLTFLLSDTSNKSAD